MSRLHECSRHLVRIGSQQTKRASQGSSVYAPARANERCATAGLGSPKIAPLGGRRTPLRGPPFPNDTRDGHRSRLRTNDKRAPAVETEARLPGGDDPADCHWNT